MKKITLIYIIAIFSLGCGQDLSNNGNGLNVDSKGLNPTEIRVFSNQSLKTDKNIQYGSELTVEINGINDFVSKDGVNVLIGGENSLVDDEKNVLYHVPDFFEKYGLKGVPKKDAESIKFNITVGKPMEAGKKYYFLFKVWDKNSDKELKGNVELNVF